jgi:hypothetical protein
MSKCWKLVFFVPVFFTVSVMNSQCCELLVIMISIFYGFCDEFIVLGAFDNHNLHIFTVSEMNSSCCELLVIMVSIFYGF